MVIFKRVTPPPPPPLSRVFVGYFGHFVNPHGGVFVIRGRSARGGAFVNLISSGGFHTLFTVPYFFPWDFRDSYASIELPPSSFATASATWGERLN